MNDVMRIRKICTRPIAEKRSIWSGSDAFYYFLIELKGSERIIVTCFMSDLILLEIGDIRTEIEVKNFIVPIRWNDSKLLNLH
jgi:hypothetical protein